MESGRGPKSVRVKVDCLGQRDNHPMRRGGMAARLLADPEGRRRIGQDGRQLVQGRLTLGRQADRVSDIYRSLCHPRPPWWCGPHRGLNSSN
jgi:hypothetical protein